MVKTYDNRTSLHKTTLENGNNTASIGMPATNAGSSGQIKMNHT